MRHTVVARLLVVESYEELEARVGGYGTEIRGPCKVYSNHGGVPEVELGSEPEAIAKRIAHLTAGSVEPPCDEDLAARLNKTFPTVFLTLTNQILILSGQGMTSPGKSKPFGKTTKSKAH